MSEGQSHQRAGGLPADDGSHHKTPERKQHRSQSRGDRCGAASRPVAGTCLGSSASHSDGRVQREDGLFAGLRSPPCGSAQSQGVPRSDGKHKPELSTRSSAWPGSATGRRRPPHPYRRGTCFRNRPGSDRKEPDGHVGHQPDQRTPIRKPPHSSSLSNVQKPGRSDRRAATE